MSPLASVTGTPVARPTANTDTAQARQQTVYQSGPVMYAAKPSTYPAPRAATSLPSAAATLARGIASSGSAMSVSPAPSHSVGHWGHSDADNSWVIDTASSVYGGASRPCSPQSSPFSGSGHYQQPVSYCGSSASAVGSGSRPRYTAHADTDLAVGLTGPALNVAASPTPSASAMGPSDLRHSSSPTESVSQASSSPVQTSTDHDTSPPAVSVSSSPVFPATADFAMNDRNLLSTLSAAADQPTQADRPQPETNSNATPRDATTTPANEDISTSGSVSQATSPLATPSNGGHHLPRLRPPSPPSPPHSPQPPPLRLALNADLTLTIRLNTAHRTFQVASPVLHNFTAWSRDNHHGTSSVDTTTHDPATRTCIVDLTPFILHLAGAGAGAATADEKTEIEEAHLDALRDLLLAMHDPGPAEQGLLGIDALWRLGGLQPGLRLRGRWVEWLRGRCMGAFVARLGVVSGWLTRPAADDAECGGGGGGAVEMMERALNVCAVFGWTDEFRAVAARLAFVCGVGEDGETGERVLVKPGGVKIEEEVCGRRAVGECAAACC